MLLKVQIIMLFFGMYATRTKIKRIFAQQHAKGLAKYGRTLAECPHDAYDWKTMCIEELVDFVQYAKKMKT